MLRAWDRPRNLVKDVTELSIIARYGSISDHIPVTMDFNVYVKIRACITWGGGPHVKWLEQALVKTAQQTSFS
jgi:hypothetical protein